MDSLAPSDHERDDDQDLAQLGHDGTMDYAKWPSLLERVIPRLEHIVYNDFPLPSIPVPGPLLQRATKIEEDDRKSAKRDSPETPEGEEPPVVKRPKLEDEETEIGPQEATKEDNQDPTTNKLPSADDTNSADLIAPPPQSLPPILLTLLQTIISTLCTSFPTSPPHTAQRLAELILHPNKHYRTLPSYLRALDRIVSVASPVSIFPLPNVNLSNSTNGTGIMLNGTSSPSPDPADDVDFIGGAELTEISWLRDAQGDLTAQAHNGAPSASDLRTESTSLIDGPNGAGSVETVTVSVNGVSSSPAAAAAAAARGEDDSPTNTSTEGQQHGISQGELLRQEQEAGIVPVPSPTHSSSGGRMTRSSTAASAAASRAVGIVDPDAVGEMPTVETPEGEETVHARGPNIIGMEDMGPQAPGSGLEGGIDVEGALGRKAGIVTPSSDAGTLDSATVVAESVGSSGATQELDGMDLSNVDGGGSQLDSMEEGEDFNKEKKHKEDKTEDKDTVIADAEGVPEGTVGQQETRSEEGSDSTML